VTIAGHPSHDLAPGTLNSIFKRAQMKNQRARCNMYRFLIVIEKTKNNFSAYSPDLLVCATGKTREEVGAICMKQ
jgi:hypothetical protein